MNLGEELAQQFDIKSLETLKYFWGIEVASPKEGMFISQHKYLLDLLKETGMIDNKLASTPILIRSEAWER